MVLRATLSKAVMLPLCFLAASHDACGQEATRSAATSRPASNEGRSTLPGAGGAGGAVNLGNEVYAILRRSCFDCHGKAKQKGDLRLDDRQAALASDEVIVPGHPEQSELIRRISLAAGRRRVHAGAGDAALARGYRAHPCVGCTRGAMARRSGRDTALVVHQAGPARAPRGERGILAAEFDRSLRPGAARARGAAPRPGGRPGHPDPAPLARSHRPAPLTGGGRRLPGRHCARCRWSGWWTGCSLAPASASAGRGRGSTCARYADSHGFQRDDLRDLWAYRDWVIGALNADMPFDQFTIEQTRRRPPSRRHRIAADRHRLPSLRRPTSRPARSRRDADQPGHRSREHHGNGLARLDAGMRQCHDHKYDPFTQKDYYQLFAFFNNTAIEADRSNPKVPGSIRFLGPAMTLSSIRSATRRGDRLAGGPAAGRSRSWPSARQDAGRRTSTRGSASMATAAPPGAAVERAGDPRVRSRRKGRPRSSSTTARCC